MNRWQASRFAGWMWACGWVAPVAFLPVPLWVLVVVYLPVLFTLSGAHRGR